MKHAVVIGAGVVGLCSAYYSALRGWKVTVLDRHPEGHAGCSHGNAGMIVPSHFVPLAAPGAVALGLKWMFNPESPFWIKPRLDRELLAWGWQFWRASTPGHVRRAAPLLSRLHLASRECFEELAGRFEFGLTRNGLLILCKTEHALDEESRAAEQARALNIPAGILDPRAAAALEPGMRMSIAGAVHYPMDCHLSPGRFMEGLAKLARAAGVELLRQTEVTGFLQEGARVRAAQTSRGPIDADEFVLCGGSWSPALARGLGLRLPMQAGKGYSLTLPRPPELPATCAILAEARIAVTPMGQSLRIGGTMEIAGLNETINPARVRGIIRAVPEYYPGFSERDFEGIEPWSGLRPCSPDGLPYLGRTRHFRNVSIATGHAMMGLSLGPISGRLIAETLDRAKPSLDLSLLDPDRYA